MDPFIRYCDAVCLHIRSRTGRADAYRELRDHLEDHSAALAARGVPDREALAEYADRYCANLQDWKSCTVAANLLKYYERTE